MSAGYAGQLLRVDLTEEKASVAPLPAESVLKQYVGAWGLGLKILYDELPEPTYSKDDCEDRTQKVYFHVYDNYVDEKVNVYA